MICEYSCNKADLDDALEPNEDIGGIGVVIGFVATAYIVVIALVLYYFLAYDPTLDPSRPSTDKNKKADYVNPVDHLILGSINRVPWAKLGFTMRPRDGVLEEVFTKCVLMLADTQILTGYAILISAFSTIKCGLSAYHWQCLTYLAWFPAITHLSAVTILRNYFFRHWIQGALRIVLIAGLHIMVLVASIPTGHFTFMQSTGTWEDVPLQSPAICYFRAGHDARTNAFQSMLLFILLLVYGFVVRMLKFSDKVRGLVTGPAKRFGDLRLDPTEMRNKRMLPALLKIWGYAVVKFLLLQVELHMSVFAEVYWLGVTLIINTIRLAQVRELGPSGENTWSFGQILPMVLLGTPFFIIIESAAKSLSSAEETKLVDSDLAHSRSDFAEDEGAEIRDIQPVPSSAETSEADVVEAKRPVLDKTPQHDIGTGIGIGTGTSTGVTPEFLGGVGLGLIVYGVYASFILRLIIEQDDTELAKALFETQSFAVIIYLPSIQICGAALAGIAPMFDGSHSLFRSRSLALLFVVLAALVPGFLGNWGRVETGVDEFLYTFLAVMSTAVVMLPILKWLASTSVATSSERKQIAYARLGICLTGFAISIGLWPVVTVANGQNPWAFESARPGPGLHGYMVPSYVLTLLWSIPMPGVFLDSLTAGKVGRYLSCCFAPLILLLSFLAFFLALRMDAAPINPLVVLCWGLPSCQFLVWALGDLIRPEMIGRQEGYWSTQQV